MGIDAREWPNMIPYKPIGKYTADFRYLDLECDEFIVVDVKAFVPYTHTYKSGRRVGKKVRRTPQGWTPFRMRCEILKANYGIDVQVVEAKPYQELANKAGVK